MHFPRIVLATLLCAVATSADEGKPPVVEQRVVIVGQGFFPVALQLHDNRIAVVCRGGASHVGINGRLDMIYSQDSGQSWSAPVVVVDSPLDDRNPAFGEAQNGALVVAFWRAARDSFADYQLDDPAHGVSTWVTRSEDRGRTWSEPSEVDVRELGFGSPYGKMLTLPDGTMLMNIYGHAERPPGERLQSKEDHSYLYRSEDDGKTWKRIATIGRGFNETGLLRLADGTLLAAMRSAGDKATISLTRSTDGGTTWSIPRQVSPPGAHPADLVSLRDGRLLLVTGFRNPPFGLRGVVGDANGGIDWTRHFVVVSDSTDLDTGYPSSVVLTGGRVLTFYYAVGSHSHPEWRVHCGVAEWELSKANR